MTYALHYNKYKAVDYNNVERLSITNLIHNAYDMCVDLSLSLSTYIYIYIYTCA